ncbi:unnamed protein product [Prunus armeniaca]|uniref:Uncharacterized protein n=1 Tax=Prunus armeniaca TaxID=36596 RepID=A0A6J5WUX8_PRUAR|nr:unnamed protein product [Prunus armeniaca]
MDIYIDASATVKMMKQKDESLTEGAYILTLQSCRGLKLLDKEDRRTVDIYPHLKMQGWELLFSSWLMETRSLEVMHLTAHHIYQAVEQVLSCSQPKSKLENNSCSSSPYFSNDKSEIFHEDKAVVFDDSCCAWSSSDEKDLDLVLKHVTLGIPKGSFVQ